MTPPAAPPARPRVLFVGGYGRSGSTVLDVLLDRVPGVTAVGELRHLFGRALGDNELCSCGLPFRECGYWSEVLARAFPGGVDRERVDAAMRSVNRVAAVPAIRHGRLRRRSFRDDLRVYRDAFVAVYRAVQEVSGATVVVDSSKYPVHGLALSAVPELELAVVLLVRDPRAVAHSWERRRVRPEVHWEHREMPRHNVVRSALAWNLSNRLTERIGHEGRRLRVQRYEDFAAAPLPALEELASFALGSAAGPLDAGLFEAAEGAVMHTIAGNPVRLGAGRVEVLGDDAWATEMSRAKQLAVRVCCAPGMRRYGYR